MVFIANINKSVGVLLIVGASGGFTFGGDRANEVDAVWRSAAAEAAGVLDENTRDYRLRFRGGVWLTAPTGDVRFGKSGQGSRMSLEHELDIDDPEASFTGDVTLDFVDGRFEGWQLWFDVFDTSQDSHTNLDTAAKVNGTSLPKGTAVSSHLSATSIGGHVGYDLFGNLLKTPEGVNPDAELRIHALGGFRYLDFEQSMRSAGSGIDASYDDGHLLAELGGRISVLVEPAESTWGALDLSVNILGGYGFSDGSLTTIDLFVAMSWYPVDYASLSMGYRLFDIYLDDVEQENGQDFEWDAYMAGFFVGGQIRF